MANLTKSYETVFVLSNKLTEDEYNELTALLAEKTEKKEQV